MLNLKFIAEECECLLRDSGAWDDLDVFPDDMKPDHPDALATFAYATALQLDRHNSVEIAYIQTDAMENADKYWKQFFASLRARGSSRPYNIREIRIIRAMNHIGKEYYMTMTSS
jgi:hypothetical protein